MAILPSRNGFSINADNDESDRRGVRSLSYQQSAFRTSPSISESKGTSTRKGGAQSYGATANSAANTPSSKQAQPSPTHQIAPVIAGPSRPSDRHPLLNNDELPQGHSGDDKCRAVSAVIYKMIREGARNPNPIFIEDLDDSKYNYYSSGPSCCFCFGGGEQRYDMPEVKHIYVYIRKIMRTTGMGLDVTIIGLVLLDRLVKKTGLTLSPNNWKPTVFACMLLASKAWGDDEVRFCNADLTYLTGVTDYSLPDVNRIERKVLELLQYDINVSSNIYANYYFGLLAHSKPKESNNFRTKFYARPSVAKNIAARPKQQQQEKTESTTPKLATTL